MSTAMELVEAAGNPIGNMQQAPVGASARFFVKRL